MSRKLHLFGSAAVVLLAQPAVALDRDWQQQAVAAAADHARANWPKQCEPFVPSLVAPLSFELQIGEDTAARQAVMVQFPCHRIDDSQGYLFFTSDQHGAVNVQSFPRPVVEDGVVTGFSADVEVKDPVAHAGSRTIVEVTRDPEGHTVTTTEWMYVQGRFQIMHFAIDATDDGQDNPQALIENEL